MRYKYYVPTCGMQFVCLPTTHPQNAEPLVVLTEVVTPCRHAVRLQSINNESHAC
jgi:hypothetical protein